MGAEHLLWGLRQRFLEVTRGAPPLVTPQLYGIGDERNEILPLFLQRMQKKVLSEMPFFQLPCLSIIFCVFFSSLSAFFFWACILMTIPDSSANLPPPVELPSHVLAHVHVWRWSWPRLQGS